MKKKTNLLVELLLVTTVFSVFILNKVIQKSLATEEQNVVLSITPKPKVDIVLAKARTKTDVSDFKSRIEDALQKLNVDPSDVKVTAIQAQTVNMETSFQWQQDISSSIGSIAITNNGQNVEMKGNQTKAGKNAIWIMPTGNQEQKFTFDYNIDFGDSFNAAGMLLRVKQDGNVLTGYMLSFNNTWNSDAGNKNGAIWKFTYNIGSNTANMTKTLVQGLDINTSGTLNVTATDAEIVVNGGGMSSNVVYEIPEDDQSIGNGFGFFSDHYSHNCTRIGSFALKNINLETTVVRSFNEVLREPDWREEAYKFLVNIDDTENEELKNNSAYSELLTRLLNENIYFVSWGKDKNQSQFSGLVTANNGNGKFIKNTNYTTSINETASYIESIVGNQNATQTVIVNEPIKLSVNPPGIDKNTIDSQWPYGKWKIEHDYTYYENNIGQFAESGKYINNLLTTFDKTGRYVIKYKDSSIYPQEVFVHRRPIAQIGMQIASTKVTLTSQSYDKDKISNNNGIAEEEWKWKDSSSTLWHNGKLTTIDANKTYVIQLRVKDFQNTWSTPTTKYITKDTAALPVAMYHISNDNLTKYEELTINNTSYDPAGRQITSSLWEVYKNGTKIYSGTTPKTNYLTEGTGTYTMYLTVTNSSNLTSERYGRTFEIGEDTKPPEVVANPITSNWAKSITVNLKFSDEGGSLVRGYKYAITDSQATPTSWSAEIKKSEDDIVINTEGKKYLHIISYDNANNVSNDRILGPYQIDRSGPTIQVEGDFSTITTQGIITNIRVVDLLSGLKTVSVNNETLSELGNSAIQINKNGTYVIRAEDNIGNVSTKQIVVNNIYTECKAGLGHPNYSSSHSKCPICSLIEGLQVTKNNDVYDSREKQVKYRNPQNATIVEYYNGKKQKPSQVGNYSYELKVVHDGKEYDTGITGKFEIISKIVTIENIMARTRQYDGTNKVALSGGNLVGIEEGDKVGFTLPFMGIISKKDIGQYDVTIPEIVLTGEKATNYKLTQPSGDMLKANVLPRELTITELQTVARPYNQKSEIEIKGGKLNNLLEGNEDNIGFTLNGGIARNNCVGEQIVDVNAIELTNNTTGNYVLISPEPTKVQITKKEVTIENIQTENRQYDGTNIVTIQGGNLVGIETGDEVGFTLPETGSISNKDIGEYDVTVPEIVLTGEKATNYQLIHPETEAVKVSILPRELTITELQAVARPYNQKSEIEIKCGKLNNLLEGNEDNIEFVLNGGSARDNLAGEQIVDINTIQLENNDRGNYELIHPEPIKVEITKKEIKIENIIAENRQYDGTDVITIKGGELIGIEDNDEIAFILPETGTVSNKDIGDYHVIIPEIVLTGEKATNYQLNQPEIDTVKVSISPRELTIHELKGKDRKYDRTNVVEIEGGQLQNIIGEEMVTPSIPKTGTTSNSDVGTWPVEIETIAIEGIDSANYTLIQPKPEDILVDILEPDQPDLQLNTFISRINEDKLKDAETTKKTVKSNQKEIRFGDEIEVTVRIYNKGEGNGYAQKITNIIPEGMRFVAQDPINQENQWKQLDDQTIITEKLNFESGIENEIEKWQEEKIDYKDISFVLEVIEKEELEEVQNQTIIEQVDIRGQEIDDGQKEDNIVLPIKVSYTDFVAENTIQDIIEVRQNTEIKHYVPQGNQRFSKVEIDRNDVDSTQLKIIYHINITNVGSAKGKVDSVVSYLPDGLKCSLEDNPEWKLENNNSLICESFGEIEANQTKSKKLIAYGKALPIIGSKKSEVIVLSSQDIDQRIIEQEEKESFSITNINKKLFKTNNYSKAEVIFSILTGITSHYFLWILIACLSIIGIIIIYFRKKQ